MDAQLMHALACAYAASPGEDALNAALEASLPLCALIARRFASRGVEYEDLYQVASLACVQAIRAFDPEKSLKFTTYVTPTITGKVRNYIRDKGSILRASRSMQEQMAHLRRAREDFLRLYREEPTPRELAEALSWDVARVLTVLAGMNLSVASLDQQDADGLSLADRLAHQETGFEAMELRRDLFSAMETLSEKEKQVLTLRYIHGCSQREAAHKMETSQMQVSRLERRALAALRKEMDV